MGQRNVLMAAGVIAALMILCPPWETPEVPGVEFLTLHHWEYPPGREFVGYAPIFAAPVLTIRAVSESATIQQRHEPCKLSWRFLLTQYLALGLMASAAWFTVKARA